MSQQALLAGGLLIFALLDPTLARGEPPDDPYVQRDQLYVDELEAKLRDKPLVSRTWRSYRSYPLIHRAEALNAAGRQEDAIAEYQKLIANDPDQLIARWHQLILLSHLQEEDRVIPAATELIDRDPDFAPAYLHRALAERAKGGSAKARSDFEAALRIGSLAPVDQDYASRALYGLLPASDQKSREEKSDVALGIAEFAHSRDDIGEEVTWLGRAFRLDPGAESGLPLARGLMDQDKPGLAVPILEEVAATAPESDPARAHILSSLGFAEAEAGNYADAAEAWQEASKIFDDPALKLRVAWALRRAGGSDESLRLLSKIDASRLEPKDHATWHEEHAALLEATAVDGTEIEAALASRRAALELNPTVSNRYGLAAALYRQERSGEARDVLRAASQPGLENPALLALAGYVESREGDLPAAIDYWRRSLALEPHQIGLREDLAYAYMRDSQNAAAARTFREALTYSDAWPNRTDADRLRKTEKEIRFRRQIRVLEQSFSFLLYDSYSPSRVNTSETGAILGVPSSAAFGTAQGYYRPPLIGYRDGRVFELTSRIFAANKDQSPLPNLDTVQAALGVRYKPLKSQNLWIGVERFFKIGKQSENNTLLRASWSYTQGNDWLPLIDSEGTAIKSPLYINVYVDAAQFLERNQSTLFYAEGRLGKTFRIRSDLLASPFLYVLGNGSFSSLVDAIASEAGGGLVVRLATWKSPDYGSRIGIEALIRVGHELQNNQADTESRILIGLQLGY